MPNTGVFPNSYRQDFEGGSILGTACPELIDLDAKYSIDSTGTHAFTGTHSLKLAADAVAHSIMSNIADLFSGDVTVSGYFNVSSTNASIDLLGQASATVATPPNFLRVSLGVAGLTITQGKASVFTTLNTPITGVTVLTGTWICLELRCHGTTISVRAVRQDNGQFFVNTGSGSWSGSPPALNSSNSGTATLAEIAGFFGIRAGDGAGLYVDDLFIEPAVPQIDSPTFSVAGAGSTFQLNAGGFTDPIRGVTWSSSDVTIATVSSGGLVTAVAAGTVTITATGKRDTGQHTTAVGTITTSASAYTVTEPSPTNGFANVPFIESVKPNGLYSGIITGTPSGGGLTSANAIAQTWSGNSISQDYTWTPTALGLVTITWSNTGSLSGPLSSVYTSDAPTLSISPTIFFSGSIPTATFTGGGTRWNGNTPTITETGVGGVTVGPPSILSDTSLACLLTTGSLIGTATFMDSTTGATCTAAIVNPPTTFTKFSTVQGFAAGLLGTVGYSVWQSGNSTTPYAARTTATSGLGGIAYIDNTTSTGYCADVFLPISFRGAIVWDDGSGHTAVDEVSPRFVEPPSGASPAGYTIEQAIAELKAFITGNRPPNGASIDCLAPDGRTARVTIPASSFNPVPISGIVHNPPT